MNALHLCDKLWGDFPGTFVGVVGEHQPLPQFENLFTLNVVCDVLLGEFPETFVSVVERSLLSLTPFCGVVL